MRKTLTLILAVALFGILTAVVVAQVGDDPTAAGTATTETTETTESVPTQTTPERTTTSEDDRQRVRTDTVEGEDISGPCDEAEHAGDPRCNGAILDDHDRGDDGGEDNSGPGSSSSGHGGGGDIEDDSSGSGHSGGGEDSSGHGGGDD